MALHGHAQHSSDSPSFGTRTRSVIACAARKSRSACRDMVELLHPSPGGDYQGQLRGGIRLPVSRSRYAALERWLGLEP